VVLADGVMMASAVRLTPAHSPDLEWESEFATLVFQRRDMP
jgi:hypothetical protein